MIYIVCGVVIGAALVSLVILPAVLPGALSALGFTASGPLLGTQPPFIHSTITHRHLDAQALLRPPSNPL